MRATDLLEGVIRLWLVAVAGLAVGIVAVVEGYAWAWLLSLGAGMLLSVLTVLAAGLRRCKREQAASLVRQGFEDLPVDAIQRERERVVSHTRARRTSPEENGQG